MEVTAWVYILTNKHHTTFYVGSTDALTTRLWEHQTRRNPKCFTARYNVLKPVYYESFSTLDDAREREEYIKGKSRKWKEALITNKNPPWNDLTEEINLMR